MAQNAVRSVQTHSSPEGVWPVRLLLLPVFLRKISQVGVSRLTRRNLPLSLKLSVCVFMYRELLFLLLSLPLAVHLARYASQDRVSNRGGGFWVEGDAPRSP